MTNAFTFDEKERCVEGHEVWWEVDVLGTRMRTVRERDNKTESIN